MANQNPAGDAEAELDRLFGLMRVPDSEPDEALMARILADAAAETERRSQPVPFRRRGVAVILEAVGGWRAAAAIAACMLAGFVLGASGERDIFTAPAVDLTADDAVVSFDVVESDDLLSDIGGGPET